MSIIYTNQSSGAIRRLKNKKPTKAYKEALKKHIKYLQKLGFDCDDTGRIQLTTSGGYYLDIAERTMPEPREKTLSDVPMSNKIGHGGTKPDNSWKIEASKNFTIVPAYNKGPYMVVNKSDLKTAGRKV
jgi:hypothetical protein